MHEWFIKSQTTPVLDLLTYKIATKFANILIYRTPVSIYFNKKLEEHSVDKGGARIFNVWGQRQGLGGGGNRNSMLMNLKKSKKLK